MEKGLMLQFKCNKTLHLRHLCLTYETLMSHVYDVPEQSRPSTRLVGAVPLSTVAALLRLILFIVCPVLS